MRQLSTTLRYASVAIAPILAITMAGCSSEEKLHPGDYPTDDVTILVPYTAGGTTDTMARTVAKALGEHFDGNFIVENQPGSGGATAISSLLNGPDDGTMLSVLASPTFLIPPASGKADYSLDDLKPIGLISEQPVILLENASASDNFLEAAETERRTVGTNGPETSAGIDVQRLADESDLELEQIPFEGQSELVTNLLGDNLDAIVVNVTPDILEGIDAGDYHAIATFSEERVDYLPDVPTLDEEGFDMATNATSQFGLVASEQIDPIAEEALNGALQEILTDEDVRQRIGEEYVSEDYIDGSSWFEKIEQTQTVYEEFFGANQ